MTAQKSSRKAGVIRFFPFMVHPLHWSGRLSSIMFGATLLATCSVCAESMPGDTGVAEIYTRGPIHEAFAAAISFDPVPGIIVVKEPPELIQEALPAQRPNGDNVAWIPGYWVWEEEISDFVWISGIWRNLPPNRQWVPGYWVDIGNRHQWTSGYWENQEAAEITYLPKPPRSLEAGPNVPADSDDQTWLPGSWFFNGDRYLWSSGSWSGARSDWVWSPASYHWTPRGYVYVDGYWDYAIETRGVVFAPVRFDSNYRSIRGFQYSPRTVISLAVFTNHLFVRPHYGHYYFGDYYAPRYRESGYFPSFSYGSDRRGYDPIASHFRWQHRHDRAWDRDRREYFEYRRDHENARPPRTWAALSSRSNSNDDRGDYNVAKGWDQFIETRGAGFRTLDTSERQRYATQRDKLSRFSAFRKDRESRKGRSKESDSGLATAIRLEATRSPVAGERIARVGKKGNPPASAQAYPGIRSGTGDPASPKLERNSPRVNGGANKSGQADGDKKRQLSPQGRQGDRERGNPASKLVEEPKEGRANPPVKRSKESERQKPPQPVTEKQIKTRPEPSDKSDPKRGQVNRPTEKRNERRSSQDQTQDQPEKAGPRAPSKSQIKPQALSQQTDRKQSRVSRPPSTKGQIPPRQSQQKQRIVPVAPKTTDQTSKKKGKQADQSAETESESQRPKSQKGNR